MIAQRADASATAPHTQSRFHGTVAHRIALALRRHGVSLVFGQSLPTIVHLADSEMGVRQVAYRQENTGGYMADGYARISHRVGVVTAQNGPAAALLVPPLAEAFKASIPLVALVQEVNRDQTDRNAFQELDHEALFRPCTKWVRRVIEPNRIDDYVDMAFTAAASGRPGPAMLLLPADLLQQQVTAEPSRSRALGFYPLDRTCADPAQIAQAAELLRNATAPVIIAGGGVHLSDASAALAALQETASIPVATTVMGKGVVADDHPLSIGVVGYFMGRNSATHYLRSCITDADVVLLVGNRTNQNGTDSWTLYPRAARYIHIDADGTEIGRNYEALRLVGDARLTLEALTAQLAAGDLRRRQAARATVANRIAEGRRRHAETVAPLLRSDAAPIRPERVMAEIEALVTPDTVVVADASYASIWVANYIRVRQPGMRFLTPRGLAGLGWGFPMAMGAKFARPDAPVICVVGDGGFGHAWAELEAARRQNLAITLIVLNNGVLAYQQHAEDIKFGTHTDACHFAAVDHAAIARACGCDGVRIERAAELRPALEKALAARTVTLIDVLTDPDAKPPITVFEA